LESNRTSGWKIVVELIAWGIGFIIAVILTGIFGGNIVSFIIVWAVSWFLSNLFLVLTGFVLGVLARWLIVILVIVLLISLIKRVTSK